MSSCRNRHPASVRAGLLGLAAAIGLLVAAATASGTEFEASTAPDGKYLLKIYPRFFYTSACFDDDGRASNLENVSGLFYFELPTQVQYGITGAFSIGAILPVGWTYQEQDDRQGSVDRVAVRDVWLTFQYRWLTFPFVSSSSLRVKLPLAEKRDWEDGLGVGDGQVDILPAYHFDYYNQAHYWYLLMTAAYKYRFKKGDNKPLDEIKLYTQGGYELFPDLRMRLYLYADLTRFTNGEFAGDPPAFFEHDGNLHSFGYGVSLWPRPTFRLELTTGGDWSGNNQYRAIRWEIGITKIL